MDRFEAFRESLGSMASFPSVTPALFEKFEAANRELLEKADLTPVQKAAISAELQNTPGGRRPGNYCAQPVKFPLRGRPRNQTLR